MISIYIINSFKRASSEAGDAKICTKANSTKPLVAWPGDVCI